MLGVVNARQPERVVAAHAVIADDEVLHDERQRMPDVQGAGHVRGRLDDHEALGPGRRRIGGAEGIGGKPALVDRRLDGGGVVAGCELASRRRHRCLLIGQTQDPFVEGRTGRGTTFVRGRAHLSRAGAASCAALTGGPATARVRPSPTRPATGFQPMARLSGAADGGVLLTVSAEILIFTAWYVAHSRSDRIPSADISLLIYLVTATELRGDSSA